MKSTDVIPTPVLAAFAETSRISAQKEELRPLVDEGLRLDREIKEREKRLDEIKAKLTASRDGLPGVIEGNGAKCTVTFSARLCQRIDDDKLLAKAKKISGDFFEKLFCYAPIAKFETVAKALLGDKAEDLADALKGEPGARVSFRAEGGKEAVGMRFDRN
jgi:hypothetical protein